MKKRFFALILALLSLCTYTTVNTLFAADTSQKIYPVDCQEYKDICRLYIMQGLAEPSSTGPWSGAELRKMLNTLTPDYFSDTELVIYNKVLSSLKAQPEYLAGDDFGFTFDTSFNPEIYFHINKIDFSDKRDFAYESSTKSFAQIAYQGYCGPFYGYATYDLRNAPYYTSTDFGSTYVICNIPGYQNFSFNLTNNMDTTYPDRAFASVGNDNWSIQFGKDQLCWGNGITGNMTISDNIPMHNFIRATAFSNRLKYTYLLDFFPHPKNYVNKDSVSREDQLSGLRFYQGHRLESTFFNDSLRFYLTESIIYQSTDNYVDMFILNPVSLLHNLFIDKMANSTLSLEASYSPMKKWNIYGQWIVDQMAVIGESKVSESASATPNAQGYILGVKYTSSEKTGIYYGSFETAYTTPFLYLRDGYSPDENNYDKYNVDYVVALRRNSFDSTKGVIHFDKYFLGYGYGGDALVCNLKGGWYQPQQGIECNLFYMAHGTFDVDTRYREIGKDNYKDFEFLTISGGGNHNDGTSEPKSGIEHTIDFTISGFYQISSFCTLHNQFDIIQILNKNNRGSNCFDIQNALSISFNW